MDPLRLDPRRRIAHRLLEARGVERTLGARRGHQRSLTANFDGSVQNSFGQFGQQKPIALPPCTITSRGSTALPDTGQTSLTGRSAAATSGAGAFWPGAGSSLTNFRSPSVSSAFAGGASPASTVSPCLPRSFVSASADSPAFQT